MYDIFKSRIASGGYKLADIQHRVKKLYALGDLTDDQLDDLLTMAQQNASADAERPEALALIKGIVERLEAVEKKQQGQDGTDDENGEYETWMPWDGISDKYQPGTIVSHNDQLWQSVHSGQNTWEPGTVGTESLWVRYYPESEEE